MIRVLTSPHSSSSVKLGYPTYTNGHTLKLDWKPGDALLRWGNSESVSLPPGHKTYNPQSSIMMNCNKEAAHEKLSRAVTTPQRYYGSVPENTLAVIRPVEHSGGSGFTVVPGPKPVPSGHYAMKYIKTDKEYRVWYALGKMLVARRVPMRGTAQGDEQYPCRSEWGYTYRESGSLPVLEQQTDRAFQRMDLDFGAADVLWDETNRKWYFLELNTAPSLDHAPVLSLFTNVLSREVTECLSTQ